MADGQEGVAFTPSELAAIDGLIVQLQEQGVDPNESVPLWTPVATVVTRAVLSTAAVLCVRIEEDAAKVAKIEELAKSLQSSTTLLNLIELRTRAVRAASSTLKQSRP